jgi:antitoxin FitA
MWQHRERSMASLTIRDIDESVKSRLRVRAAQRGLSMEEEVRRILRAAVDEPAVAERGLGERIRRRFSALGDVQLPIADREPVRDPLPVERQARSGRARPAKRSV